MNDERILRAAWLEEEAAGGGERERGSQRRVRQQRVEREREKEREERVVWLLLALQREERLGVSGCAGPDRPHIDADSGLHVGDECGLCVKQGEQGKAKVLTQGQFLVAGRKRGPGGEEGEEEGSWLREIEHRRIVDQLA